MATHQAKQNKRKLKTDPVFRVKFYARLRKRRAWRMANEPGFREKELKRFRAAYHRRMKNKQYRARVNAAQKQRYLARKITKST